MQQWLTLVQAAGALLTFAGALTNLRTAMIHRRRPPSGRPTGRSDD